MSYDPLAAANYFVAKLKAEGSGVTPIKLQKRVYFAEGWHQAFAKKDLIAERAQP